MSPDTLNALRGSIAKWEDIVAGTGEDLGPDNCPLCQLFNKGADRSPDDCRGCPVFEQSGYQYCINTPYERYSDIEDDDENLGPHEYRAALNGAAKAELAFLKSLLPSAGTEQKP